MRKNKGFVLMETIVVVVVISVALLTIFSSYNKILSKVKTENKFDTSEYIYMTEYIKNKLNTLCGRTISSKEISSFTSSDEYSSCITNDIFGVKKIYVLKGLNDVASHAKKFDAYMIDYLRKLDVDKDDELIIVEYRKPALKTDGVQKEDTNESKLYETYIASLRW